MVEPSDYPKGDRPEGPSGRYGWLAREGAEALQPFTLLVGFLAADKPGARCQAQAYVEALTGLRPEVDCFTAEISLGGRTPTSRVYCGAPGPDPQDVCNDLAGHPGDHHGPGLTGRWSEDDVPRAPDDIEGIG